MRYKTGGFCFRTILVAYAALLPLRFTDAYASLREEPPQKVRIAHTRRRGWLVTRHADVRQVPNDNRFGADDQRPGSTDG